MSYYEQENYSYTYTHSHSQWNSVEINDLFVFFSSIVSIEGKAREQREQEEHLTVDIKSVTDPIQRFRGFRGTDVVGRLAKEEK